MPIHLTAYKNKQEAPELDPAWEINDIEIEHLEELFENYKNRTGSYIEEYSDTFIDPGCLEPLQEATTESLQISVDIKPQNTIKKLLSLIQNAVENNEGLAFIGE